MKLMITEDSEIVVDGKKVLLEKGDEIFINKHVDKLIKEFINTKDKKLVSELKKTGITFVD